MKAREPSAAPVPPWAIRHDGGPGLTAIVSEPGRNQICASLPALTLHQFGLGIPLARD